MTFLKINGITVPVAKGGVAEIVEIGDRARAFDGTYLRDTRAIKREWKFTTTPLTPSRSQMFQGIIRGDGILVPWETASPIAPAFTATNGLYPTGSTSLATFRGRSADGFPSYDERGIIEAKYGNYSYVYEQGATNPNLANGSVGASPVNVTITTDTSNYWVGSSSAKFLTTGATASADIFDSLAGISGHNYWASCYVKGMGGTAQLSCFENVGGYTPRVSNTVTLDPTKWQRLAAYFPNGTGAANFAQLLLPTNGTTCYVDGVMCEDATVTGNAFAPQSYFVPGQNRVGLNFQYPFGMGSYPGHTGFTYNTWVTPWPAAGPGGPQELMILGDNVTYWVAGMMDATTIRFGNNTDIIAGDFIDVTVAQTNTWMMVSCVFRWNPDTGETNRYVYYNGVLKGSNTFVTTSPAFNYIPGSASSLSVGCYSPSPVFSFVGRVDDSALFPYAMDAAAVADLYGAGAGMGVLPRLSASGSFVGNDYQSTVTVDGQVDRVSFVGYHDSALNVWRANAQQIDFTLREI